MVLEHRARNLPRLLGTILLVFAVQFIVLSWYFGVKFEDMHGQIFHMTMERGVDTEGDDDTSMSPNTAPNGHTESSFRRAIVVYFPHDKQAELLPAFLGLRASWLDMLDHEPSKWRTDLVVYTSAPAAHPNTPASPLLSVLDTFGCTTTRRRSNDEPNRCVVVPSYVPIAPSTQSARLVDSIHVAAMPRMNAYQWILRTDMHAFVTRAFATWKPSAMAVSRGLYPSGSEAVLARLVHRPAPPHVGATWYGPTKLIQACAAQAVHVMTSSVVQHADLTPHLDDSGRILRLFGAHFALANCTVGFTVDVRDDMLDVPSTSGDSTADHAHVAVPADEAAALYAAVPDTSMSWQKKDVVHDYAQYMAVQGRHALANVSVDLTSTPVTAALATTTSTSTTPTTVPTTTTSTTSTTTSTSPPPPWFVRAAVVFIPTGGEGARFVQQLRWFRRSWQHMALTEPMTWRTDIVVYVSGPVPELAALNCSAANARTSRQSANACVVIPTYTRLKTDAFDYAFGDSINVLAVTDIPEMAHYDWLLRTDLDTFLTPAFSTWQPLKMTVGMGGYSFSETNAARLARISGDLGLHDSHLNNIGSTWYGPADLVRTCAQLAVTTMQYLHEHEFTAQEKSHEYGIQGWPEWHHGVLTLYAGHIAINHCTKDAGVVKDDVNLDYATTSTDAVAQHAHLHTWQNDRRFSKFVFMSGGYSSENKSALDIATVADYAMYMALDSQETAPPPPMMAPSSTAVDADDSFVRAAVVFIPRKTREDVFVKQFRWLRRSWLEMQKSEPALYRTDIVVVSDGIIKDLRAFGCTTKPRASRESPNACVLVQDYKLLYSKEDFDYRFGDSINIVAHSTPVLDQYDWLLRTDIDVFLTPTFATWRPAKMVVGGGGYQTPTNIHRLDRIASDLNLHVAGMHSVGSTWFGPTHLIQACANLTVYMMKYLHEHEFTAQEKSPAYGTKGWPEWHYGVLTLYAGHVAINHCTFESLAEKDDNMLDFPTASNEPVASHAHLHTWQNRGRFSKFAFEDGEYAAEDIDKLDVTKVSDYAMYMALDSQETPEPTLVPVSYAPDSQQGQVFVRAIVVCITSSHSEAAISHFRSLHQSWKYMLKSEPTLWRTDLVVVTDGPALPELHALGCTGMYRTTNEYKSFCVQVSSSSSHVTSDDDDGASGTSSQMAHAMHLIQLDLTELHSYMWLLRTDVSSFVTPGFSTWHPPTPVYGPAPDNAEPNSVHDVTGIATELALDIMSPLGPLTNVGSTWYGPSKWIIQCAKAALAVLLHLHNNQTSLLIYTSSGASVAMAVAMSHCTNNETAPALLNNDMLDVPTTSAAPPHEPAHLKAVMIENDVTYFSAWAFAAGAYADVQLESLHADDTVHDYAMAMALKAHGGLTPTSQPPSLTTNLDEIRREKIDQVLPRLRSSARHG
ncbi:hypothetical protein DYB31_002133 [Aphanomyces astaci]|nr:hypothetical protein DYB31_002133 [Aphanomyces astaci]